MTMRAAVAALCLVLAASAAAQLEGQVLDLAFTTSPLQVRTLDLVHTVQDLEGAAQDIEGKQQDLQVSETETEIHMELAADVLFAFDSAEIQSKAIAALKQVASVIRERAKSGEVRIEGHTDSKGSSAYNQKLSERRAQSVKDWLVKNEGLQGMAITTRGFGEDRPVAPNEKPDGTDDPEGRQKNRRVEIVVMKD
jgi:outer membrane protein OmpA-like peptidoglycan-associated protein